MSPGIETMHPLASRSLVVVTGKGGVGKTTMTAVVARAIAAHGRRVLALEVDPRESLHRLFAAPPSDGAAVAAGERLTLQHLRPRAALDGLVERRLGSSWLAARLTASPAYEQFAAGAPGLRELAVFAWIAARLAGEIPGAGEEPPETVVLDAPASGHAAAWLEAPRLVADAVGRGPVAELARELGAALADRDRTAIVLVSLAEEMPVSESLELAAKLRKQCGRLPDLAVLNGLLPPWSANGVESDEGPAAAMWRARRHLQQRELARFAAGLPVPRLELPLVAEEAGPELLAGLTPHLESELAWTQDPKRPIGRLAAGRRGVVSRDLAQSLGRSGERLPEGTLAESAMERPSREPVDSGVERPSREPVDSGVGRRSRAASAGAVERPTRSSAAAGADVAPLLVVVGAGGVGKTTLAAAIAAASSRRGEDTLVMTFDPSLRLRQALGLGSQAAAREEVEVPFAVAGRLTAALLDARRTFDGLVHRYAPDEEAVTRILDNRFYAHLAGTLAGVLEYMAVERLYEAAASERAARIVLDTPPTRQALDFLDAPRRIVSFLDSGALKVGLKDWFDDAGRLLLSRRLGPLGRRLERYLDEVVGVELLHEMNEFFQAFAPLYAGFRRRALEVERLLCGPRTGFLLVTTAAPSRVPDALFFARQLAERDMRLAGVAVNQVHPPVEAPRDEVLRQEGHRLFAWLGERDRRGLGELRSLLRGAAPVVEVPLAAAPPRDLGELAAMGEGVLTRL